MTKKANFPATQDDLLALVTAFTTRPQLPRIDDDTDDEARPLVTAADLDRLSRIILAMIDLHWGPPDAGPRRPVEVALINRTRFEGWPWVPVPYWEQTESLDAFILAIMQNARVASGRLTSALEFAEARRRAAQRTEREAATALMKATGDDPAAVV